MALLAAVLLVVSSVDSFLNRRTKSGTQIFVELGLGGVIFVANEMMSCDVPLVSFIISNVVVVLFFFCQCKLSFWLNQQVIQ